MDSIQEKALKMAFIIHCMYKSNIFNFHFKSSCSFNDVWILTVFSLPQS
jgi:hypothetical protein